MILARPLVFLLALGSLMVATGCALAVTCPGDPGPVLLGQVSVRATVLRALIPRTTAERAVRLVNRFRYIVATPHRVMFRQTPSHLSKENLSCASDSYPCCCAAS